MRKASKGPLQGSRQELMRPALSRGLGDGEETLQNFIRQQLLRDT